MSPARRTAVVTLAALLAPALAAQNSTRKLRVPPTALAERAGSAVPWRPSLDQALAEAKEKHKLVFWYVPTVNGSPMDRKPEIDGYLMAGPFSWPSTIDLLSQSFVPVKQMARGEAAKRYQLQRMKFIEPGWLVLDGEGVEKARMDQITTFHPQWFEAPLRALAGLPPGEFQTQPALREAWDGYRALHADDALRAIDAVLGQHPADGVVAEALFLRGAAQRCSGRTDESVATWKDLGERLPESPWAWKAAMEAEGHGPFVHGFEDFLPLPARVLRERRDGSRAPAGTYTQEQLWQLGVQYLLRMREHDGVLRDSLYDFGGTDSLPNVYAAVSFLAGEALLCAEQRAANKRLTLAPAVREQLAAELQALLRVADNDGSFALSDRDEILWAFAYRLRFLARWSQLHPGDREKALPKIQSAVAAVVNLQPETGVWFHEYGNPFAIATALQALAAGRAAGASIDQQAVDRGLGALLHCRTPQAVFSYGWPGPDRPPRESVEGGAGRTPLCEAALLAWGKSDQPSLQAALDTGFRHHGLMAAVRKYDDHADQYHYGGFFFWFDMLGRAEALMQVADAAARGKLQSQQLQLVLDLPEFDGCFVDSHELGRCYGTAMALLSLATLDP
jgi:hypothetical protein